MVFMTAITYLNAFRTYGADVLLIALGVTLLTSLFKKTLLKRCSKKLFVFLPFLLGTVIFTAYRMLAVMSVTPITQEIFKTLEGGFASGCAATLYYVIYEQFIRRGKTVTPLSPLLEGYVLKEHMAEAEQLLLEGGKDKTGKALCRFVRETLAPFVDAELSESELAALSALVTEYLSAIRSK